MLLKKKGHNLGRVLLAVVLTFALILSFMGASVSAAPADGVYSFGPNVSGQLGQGGDRYGNFRSPTRIAGLNNVKSVAVGDSHSLVLLHNGDLYSFGSNHYGQLGHGDNEDRLAPTKIQGIGKVKAIGAGRQNSLIVLENGDVYSFGANGFGQLGHGDTVNKLTPTKIAGLSNAAAVTGGQAHSLVLLENGDVYSIGYSASGQLGQGDGGGLNHRTPLHVASISNAKAIAAGSIHSLVILQNGDVLAFGNNRYGQLGYAPSNGSNTPVKVTGLGPAKEVSAGASFSLVLLESGDLYSFGYNRYAQLGLGDKVDRSTPTKVALSGVSMIDSGYRHSLAVLENGDVYSFGQNSQSGKLGHGDTTERATPTRIEGLQGNNGLAIAASFGHSLVVVGTPPISIMIDNKPLYTDVPPVIINGRTMVPLRAIFETLNIQVEYIAETRTIIGTKGETRIELAVDSTQSKVNGEEVTLDVPATIMEGRTLVPVRFIAESTGQNVDWDARTRTVTIEPGDNFIEPGDNFIEPGDNFIEPGDNF